MSDYIEMAQGKLGRVIVVRLRPGADVLLSLEEACREHNITNGVILSAIGSLDGVAYCNPWSKCQSRRATATARRCI